ncbi:MAG: hypothetical protein VB099_15105 [Candidatus Limiplasma sp.]|nr:hypothetical protein [Candidatus Limiplasma sp.]
MNILVLSRTPWRNDNSFGNTFTDIFQQDGLYHIIHVYCGSGHPNSTLPKKIFKIDEGLVAKSILRRHIPTGQTVTAGQGNRPESTANQAISHVKRHKWQILYWMQELVWLLGKWKTEDLVSFLENADIDLIFQPIYPSFYMNRISRFMKNYTQKPMVCFTADDAYTLKQFSLSPLFWIDRLLKRRAIRKTILSSELLYVISEAQKKEYEKIFNKPCKILTKQKDFSGLPRLKTAFHSPMRLVYAGNIGIGRWRTLGCLAQEIEKVNARETRMELFIYTGTPITKSIRKALSGKGTHLSKPVPASEIAQIQSDADILIHAEGFRFGEGLRVRHSFSTKIVDYLAAGRCILALGRKNTASIEHLKKNNAALLAQSKAEIPSVLQRILKDRAILNTTAQNGWLCGQRYHNASALRKMLLEDLHAVVKQ